MKKKKIIAILFIIFIIVILMIQILIKRNQDRKTEIYIKQEDIIKKQEEIEYLSNIHEDYREKDPVKEVIKEKIELEEANKANIEITNTEQLKKFRNAAEKEYEAINDKELKKEEYIEKFVNEIIDMEKRNLFYADIGIKIATKTFECDDPKVKEELEKFNSQPSIDQLDKVYDEYINYLSNNYEIKY